MQLPAASLLVTIPHSGERVPDQAPWLKNLAEEVLMCDVDRFVDVLYEPVLQKLRVPFVKTEWHRYAGDLNRIPEDVDAGSVQGHATQAGPHRRGFLWAVTTYNHILMPQPVSVQTHQELVNLIYEPFHASVRKLYENYEKAGRKKIYHLDAHSMPSVGTQEHRDPGQRRADIVISDCHGKSCEPAFRDLVIASYVTAGFKVGYNWPYFGGRVSETYGVPSQGHHAIQVELNRDLYMDEKTKKLKPAEAKDVQKKIELALTSIAGKLPALSGVS
jgi:N-formylglutamate amidohydrolase